MTRTETTEREIDDLWRTCFAQIGHEPPSLTEGRTVRRHLLDKNSAKATEWLQPWLTIFEFALDWLGQVHLALTNENDVGPSKPDYAVPWALVGAACAFGWAVRNTCVAGFDTPGRALLRTYVESLFLCLAALHDKALAKAYLDADSDAKAVTFWHTYASPKNLHKRIIQIEGSLGLSPADITHFTAWRREEYEVMSQSSHLSYLAACMTCLPASMEDDEIHQFGVFGVASSHSHRTIGYAARTAWYFSRLSYRKLIGPVGSTDSLLVGEQKNEFHRNIIVGWEVLSRLTLKYWRTNTAFDRQSRHPRQDD
jgi:hypothetical protein